MPAGVAGDTSQRPQTSAVPAPLNHALTQLTHQKLASQFVSTSTVKRYHYPSELRYRHGRLHHTRRRVSCGD